MTKRKHRVIFPPDDYWTHPPKENTMTANPAAGDCRRATAVVVHYGTNSSDGISEVFKESVEIGRVTELILALLDLFQNVVPQLLTDLGMACISDALIDLANDETADPRALRASRLIIGHSHDDVDQINTVFAQAKEANQITELILDVLHMYNTVAPCVFTPLGVSALQRSVMNFAAQEDAP